MKRKNILLILLITLAVLNTRAVPALRQLQTHVQPDGTELSVMLCGDEHLHYYMTADGQRMELCSDGFLRPLSQKVMETRINRLKTQHTSAPKRTPGKPGVTTGEHRGLFILVEFPDIKFSRPDIKTVYDSICNMQGYATPPYKGSVRDYFLEQSDGQFDLTFDIVGPVKVSNNESRYGMNSGWGIDDMVPELVLEVIDLVKDSVNFHRYDWDDDGECDQVFLLYAGYGEAQGGPEWTIWPSEGQLSRQRGGLKCPVIDGVTIDTFALSCELKGKTGTRIDGIGTICHEISHCLGLPDFYNTSDMDDFCMDAYELMDVGAYNGGSYQPAAYTGYERWFCGWREPIELTDAQVIDHWQPLELGGPTYIIYNAGDRKRNEYYLLDNRQYVGFDASLYSAGLVVMHVDYDEQAWTSNQVNSNKKHQRLTLIPADNIKDVTTCNTDAFPYTYLNGQRTLDSLTNSSRPQATVFTKNTDGSNFLNRPIYNIRQNDDLTMSFAFLQRTTPTSIWPQQADNLPRLPQQRRYDLNGRHAATGRSGIVIEQGKKIINH